MQQKSSNTEKMFQLMDNLPECCASFLMETQTERSSNTRLAYARDLGYFFDYLISYHPYFAEMEKKNISIKDLNEVKTVDINRYISTYSKNHSERTVARKKAAVSSFFSYLYNTLHAIQNNPVDGATRVKIHTKDFVVHLNVEEQNKLLNSVMYGTGLTPKQLSLHPKYQKRDLALIMLFLDTGMRISEAHGINLKDLDMDECSVIVERKGGNFEKVYFGDSTKECIEDYLSDRKAINYCSSAEDPLFITRAGNRLSVRQIEEIVPKYIAASMPEKMDRITPHRLRASFAMTFYGETKNLLLLQKKMAHKNIMATNIYAKATDTESRDNRNVIDKLRQK